MKKKIEKKEEYEILNHDVETEEIIRQALEVLKKDA